MLKPISSWRSAICTSEAYLGYFGIWDISLQGMHEYMGLLLTDIAFALRYRDAHQTYFGIICKITGAYPFSAHAPAPTSVPPPAKQASPVWVYETPLNVQSSDFSNISRVEEQLYSKYVIHVWRQSDDKFLTCAVHIYLNLSERWFKKLVRATQGRTHCLMLDCRTWRREWLPASHLRVCPSVYMYFLFTTCHRLHLYL